MCLDSIEHVTEDTTREFTRTIRPNKPGRTCNLLHTEAQTTDTLTDELLKYGDLVVMAMTCEYIACVRAVIHDHQRHSMIIPGGNRDHLGVDTDALKGDRRAFVRILTDPDRKSCLPQQATATVKLEVLIRDLGLQSVSCKVTTIDCYLNSLV
jgi:hypothetical protein